MTSQGDHSNPPARQTELGPTQNIGLHWAEVEYARNEAIRSTEHVIDYTALTSNENANDEIKQLFAHAFEMAWDQIEVRIPPWGPLPTVEKQWGGCPFLTR